MRFVVVMLAACNLGDPASAPHEPPAPVSPVVQRRAPEPWRIRWVNVVDTPPCFYFSGPEGRDDKLVGTVTIDRAELDGDVTVKINGIAFKGTFRDQQLRALRTSEHRFGGSWTATEEIRGKVDASGALVGTYSYRECEHGNTCPGSCRIDADIQIARY